MIKKKILETVKMSELGIMISVIRLDYKPENNEELALMIQEHFNVICTEKDITNYEDVMVKEDFETASRRHSFFHNFIR